MFILEHVRGKRRTFGGVQIIASGSFKQLSPVPNIMNNDLGDFCFLDKQFKEGFKHRIHLDQVNYYPKHA